MELTINMAGEKRVVKLLEDTADRAGDLSAPLADFGERLVRRIGKRIAKVLTERTGRLSASLVYQAGPDKLTVSAGGATPGEDMVKYAKIQHHGGVIRPKKKKFLTIPFPGGPADKRAPLEARDFTDTFITKGIIFRKLGKKKKIEPLFILKKEVRIPAHPYMYTEDSDMKYLKRSVADHIAGKWGRD